MKSISSIILCLLALLFVAGCAKTKITSRAELVTEQLPMPTHIWVYDFAATPADVPDESVLAGQYSEHSPPQTAEYIATGRKLGAQIAAELVGHIRDMGLPAVHAVPGTKPQINDIVIRVYLISFEEGSAEKRVAIGFGSGASDLKVAVEGLQVTPQGLRKLGSGTEDAAGGEKPGGALGVAVLLATHNPAGLIVTSGMSIYGEKTGSDKVEGRAKKSATEIAKVLKKRFQEQGWID